MVSEDDGGGTLENTLKYFEKYGKHKGKFNEYYATVYFAEQALAESVSGGITEAELKILAAYDQAVQDAYNSALNSVSQSSFDQGMLSSNRTPLAVRGSEMGFGLLPEISDPEKKNEILMAGGLLLYSSRLIKTDVFHRFPNSFDQYIMTNGTITINTGKYTQANMPGYVNGVAGEYEIGWETMPDGTKVITHRFFRPSIPVDRNK